MTGWFSTTLTIRRIKLSPADNGVLKSFQDSIRRARQNLDEIRLISYQVMIHRLRNILKVDLKEFFKGKKVLEVGCSTGFIVSRLREEFGAEAHGLDKNEKMIANENEPFLHPGEAAELPFSDGSFDIVLSKSLLDLLPPAELKAFMQEAFRVLKPGGQMIHFFKADAYLFGLLYPLTRKAGFNEIDFDLSAHIFEKPADKAE
ncbi:MAG: class I SAM-dependent methyltransferase [Candidatus Margulisiibacteriota bacterium]